jgi:hypothetical protein
MKGDYRNQVPYAAGHIWTWYIRMRRGGLETLGMVRTLRYFGAISLILIGVCVFLSGCTGSETIWSAESPSPDGSMLATGRTIANSGFGTGYIWTAVYLGGANRKQEPIEILELTDEFEMPSNEISVEMKWLTPTHLELTYRGHQTLYFQAIRWAGVDISVRDLSIKTNTPQK